MMLFSKILDLIPVACIHLTHEGNIDYVNAYTELLFDKKKEVILEANFWDAFPAWKSTDMFGVINEALSDNHSSIYEFISDDAQQRIKLSAETDDEGVVLIFNTVADVEVSKSVARADDALGAYEARYRTFLGDKIDLRTAQLKKSEERFQMFVDVSADMVYEMNADWTEMHQLRGKDFLVDTNEPTHGWLGRYIPIGEQNRVREAIDHSIANKCTFELEHQVRMVDGGIGWTRSRAIPVLNEEGQIIQWFGTAKDITAAKEVEQRIRDLEIKQQQEIVRITLNTQEEERQRLSEGLHNGLGQLLYAIRLSLDYLSLDLATHNPTKFSNAKKYTSGLLSDAISECRNLSHELMPTLLAEFGLDVAIQDICREMEDSVHFKSKVELGTIKLDSFMEVTVYRMVQQLVANVVEHAHANGVVVDIYIENTSLILRVTDDGQGMPLEHTQQSGIGLSSLRAKAQILKGDVRILSSSEKGTLIEVTLPLMVGDGN